MKKRLTMRIAHRWLGFFLLGIMVIYSLSGVVLVFRRTNAFKLVTQHSHVLPRGLNAEELKEHLELRRLRNVEESEGRITFEGGFYERDSGQTEYETADYPPVLKQMVEMHVASTQDRRFVLNVFFGLALLFFSVSSFWMFRPKSKVFKQGMVAVGAGILFAVAVLYL